MFSSNRRDATSSKKVKMKIRVPAVKKPTEISVSMQSIMRAMDNEIQMGSNGSMGRVPLMHANADGVEREGKNIANSYQPT